jgi:hypothetical protein
MRLTDDELDEAMKIAQSLKSLRLTAAMSELRERRDAERKPILPTNPEAERTVDALMASAITASTSRRLTMPALTDEERELLSVLRDMVDVNTKACRTRVTTAALAVLDRLIGGGR